MEAYDHRPVSVWGHWNHLLGNRHFLKGGWAVFSGGRTFTTFRPQALAARKYKVFLVFVARNTLRNVIRRPGIRGHVPNTFCCRSEVKSSKTRSMVFHVVIVQGRQLLFLQDPIDTAIVKYDVVRGAKKRWPASVEALASAMAAKGVFCRCIYRL